MGNRTLPILMILGGGLLIYCAVHNKSPAEVIKGSFLNNPGGARVGGTLPKTTGDNISTKPVPTSKGVFK